jgi:HK97 gp10 family phage protein
VADIKFSGLDEVDFLADAIEASRDGAPKRVSKAVKDSTTRGGLLARANAPVLTGSLKSKIRDTSSALSGLIVSDESYSGFVNWGTSRQAPNPYMGRALNVIEPEFIDAVTEAGHHEF